MTDTTQHHVLVVDDHPLFRKGVVQLLQLEPSFIVDGEAGTYEEAIEKFEQFHPGLVLLDLNMKGTNGIEILSAIKSRDPSTRVIMLTVSDNPTDLVQAIRSGVDGYLLKDQDPDEILSKIKMAVEGKTVLSPQLMSALSASLKQDDNAFAKRELKELTNREIAVLQCIAKGMSNKAIARELDISDGTVKVHVKHVLRKLSFRSRVEAAVWMAEKEREGK